MPALRAFERRFRDSGSEEGTVMATVLAYVISDTESSGRREILAAFRADESIHSLLDQGLLQRVQSNLTRLECSAPTSQVAAERPTC
jgi:tellurite resistance protein